MMNPRLLSWGFKVRNRRGSKYIFKKTTMAIIQFLIVLVSPPATWRSMIRTAVCRSRCGTGTWPAATTSWDHCRSASRSSRSKEWMDGEIKGGMNGGGDGETWGRETAQVEEEGEWRWPCSLLHCWRNTLVGALLFILVILCAKASLPCLFISASLSLHYPPSHPLSSSVSISLYLPLFLSFCWRCPVRDFNEMPAFEVEWWRWRDAIKNLIFRAERTCASVCFPPLHLRAAPKTHTCWHQEPERGTQWEWHEHDSWGLQLKFCMFS